MTLDLIVQVLYEFQKFIEKDFGFLVSVLGNQDPVDKYAGFYHPWAQPPKTIGSLALFLISNLVNFSSSMNFSEEEDFISND